MMTTDKTTRVFLVLNEDTMEIERFNDQPEDQRPKLVARMFATEKQADKWASKRLDMWWIVESHFKHHLINHKPNQ